MSAPDSIAHLCETYDEHRDHYQSQNYNETELRREFLDPLFGALGWDIDNKQGFADAYKDVVHEDAIKIGGFTKAPDYCFRVGGARKFFLEAKKPALSLKSDADAAFQLRRYAWSAKLPVSLLSNFREFAVYETRGKPSKNDSAATARTFYCTYDKLEEKWEEIAGTFSKQAVLKGSFDKYVDSTRKKRGTAEVDDAFLEEIERWRDLLARTFAHHNPGLSVRDLNYAVQKTIDRIIFLRICEDRGMEDYSRLSKLQNGANVWERLLELFRQADDRYNSGLFYFGREKDRPGAPDTLTTELKLDDRVIKDIVKHLYYPDSPYEFSVLPADILGHVYEQFLGKTIRLTKGHQAKIEEKPEVRKAGGVYYTPTYIVDYIVGNTLGRHLNGPDPNKPKPMTPAKAAGLKVLDPACGSGSFLLGAYQYLLNWYQDRYAKTPGKYSKGKAPKLFQGRGGEWRLTTTERKRILVEHIHGVDLDAQAVEVTKLSLLLKVLEGETIQLPQRNFIYERERILPDLGNNIQCGNSLIGTDFYEQEQMSFLDEEIRDKINAFDWHAAFPGIMKRGGFDCVIGNPPYLNVDDVWGKSDKRLEYLNLRYSKIYNDKTDLFFYFLYLGLQLARSQVGMIVSRAFLEGYKADKLRLYLKDNYHVSEIVDFRDYQVFNGVGIATAIVVLDKINFKGKTKVYHFNKRNEVPNLFEKPAEQFSQFSADITRMKKVWSFGTKDRNDIFDKIDKCGVPICRFLHIGKGMETGANKVFGNKVENDIERLNVPNGKIRFRASNSDIQRYNLRNRGEFLLWLDDVKRFSDLPNPLQAYLKSESKKLKERAAFKRGDCEWWKFTWPLHREFYNRPKILCPYLAQSNRFALDEKKEFIGLTDTTVLFDTKQNEALKYFLGLLNSKLLDFRYKGFAKLKGGGVFEYFWNSIQHIPIRSIDFDKSADVAKHDKMVHLVERMLELNKRKASEKNPNVLNRIESDIAATDKQIDRLVYKLYDLTQKEIEIVEKSFSSGEG